MKSKRNFRYEDSFERKSERRKNFERQKSKELMDYAAEELGKIIRQIKRDKAYR